MPSLPQLEPPFTQVSGHPRFTPDALGLVSVFAQQDDEHVATPDSGPGFLLPFRRRLKERHVIDRERGVCQSGHVWLDGLTQKVREGGRIVNVCVVVATGVNAEGQREILGLDVGTSEDGAFWLAFPCGR